MTENRGLFLRGNRNMHKKRQQSLFKRYVSFFAFCVIILLIGAIVSVPIKVEVHSIGEKPPFLFAVLFSVLLLTTLIGEAYLSYLFWFQGEKARTNLTTSIDQLANRFFIFRLPIYNPTFLFWFMRLTLPVTALMLFGLFRLVLLSAF
jgi:hypothetical protein